MNRLTDLLKRRERWATAAGMAGIVLLTIAAYVPALNGGQVWDDDFLIFDNTRLRTPAGLYDFWFTGKVPDFFPLSSTLWWIEYHLWGAELLGYHMATLALHVAAVVLLWRVLAALRVPGALLAAGVFALHPVNMASVAWLSEQKNTLSLTLYLAATLLFLGFERRPSALRYTAATLCFALALLAKPTLVALPVILLALAWWRRGRIGRADIFRMVPWFALSAGVALLTILFQQRGLTTLNDSSLLERILRAATAIWFYAGTALFPAQVMGVYPRWGVFGASLLDYLPLLGIIALFTGLWFSRGRLGRGPIVAAACFVLALAPVLGVFSMSFSQYSFVSDHLAYAGMTVFAACIAAAIVRLSQRAPSAAIVTPVVSALLLLACAGMSLTRAPEYKSDLAFWTAAVAADPDNALVEFNYADAVREDATFRTPAAAQPRFDEAIRAYLKATELGCGEAENNLAGLLVLRGRVDEAMVHMEAAVAYQQRLYDRLNVSGDKQSKNAARMALVDAHVRTAALMIQAGKFDGARQHFYAAHQLDPTDELARPFWPGATRP